MISFIHPEFKEPLDRYKQAVSEFEQNANNEASILRLRAAEIDLMEARKHITKTYAL